MNVDITDGDDSRKLAQALDELAIAVTELAVLKTAVHDALDLMLSEDQTGERISWPEELAQLTDWHPPAPSLGQQVEDKAITDGILRPDWRGRG